MDLNPKEIIVEVHACLYVNVIGLYIISNHLCCCELFGEVCFCWQFPVKSADFYSTGSFVALGTTLGRYAQDKQVPRVNLHLTHSSLLITV